MRWQLTFGDKDFDKGFSELLQAKREVSAEVDRSVAKIISEVRQHGDEALFDFTLKFDQLDLKSSKLTGGSLRLDKKLIAELAAQVPLAEKEALELAAKRIAAYHAKQLPQDLDYRDEIGLRLGSWWRPVRAAGLYVPGGTAAYPSSFLMNAIPAKAAGVERIVASLPAPSGKISPLVMLAAQLVGVDEIYLLGGAQAIAAMAYGSQSLAPVDVIVGPGRDFVAAAKRQVFGQVGIDMLAGPSEVLVISDDKNPLAWVAMDLLSQAEHDESAQAILLCTCPHYAQAVQAEIERQLARLPRREIARKSWQNLGAIIVSPDLEAAIGAIDALAPEHLEIMLEDEEALALGKKIRNAGAVFLGRYSPEALGDYLAGPNHVLPTARTARYASGLSVFNFMKRSSFLSANSQSLKALSLAGQSLARAEGLEAHALSFAVREEVSGE